MTYFKDIDKSTYLHNLEKKVFCKYVKVRVFMWHQTVANESLIFFIV